jgi:hypothetical protein
VPGALSLGVKRLGCEADHTPPYSAKVKNTQKYTSTPQYAFMAWCSVKAQGQLYLLPLQCVMFTLLQLCLLEFGSDISAIPEVKVMLLYVWLLDLGSSISCTPDVTVI